MTQQTRLACWTTRVAAGFLAAGAMALAPRAAAADTTADAPAATAEARGFTDIFGDFQLSVTLDGSGPLRFKDTADTTLDTTEVFEYGAGVGLMFGDERVDLHRVGLGVSFDRVARSADRTLAFITPHIAYEIGHPLVLQLDLGYSIATGTAGFKDNYKGIYTGFVLRYALRSATSDSPVSVSPGLVGAMILTPDDSRFSSAFLGAQIEFTYHSAH